MPCRKAFPCLAILLSMSMAAMGQTSDVDVRLDQFGVGSAFRPGGYAGMRIELTSRLTEPTSVWVQWEKPNTDGDIAENGRSLTLTPGQPTKVWLYAPLTEDDSVNDVWIIKVFEEVNGNRGREIGGARVSPNQAQTQSFQINSNLIGIVGSARLGLDDYMAVGPRGRTVAANEETRIISGIRPEDLPDRWFALQMFEAIAWGAGSSPGNLSFDQAEALREYIRRGGHLIIILPTAGNPWGIGSQGQTPFESLLPTQMPQRQESVPLSDVLPVLSKSSNTRGEITLNSINVFGVVGEDTPEGGVDFNNYFEPLTVLPDGRIVVIRRSYGFGHVTLSGIDVSSNRMLSLDIPEADIFWNRILGRRQDTPSTTQLTDIGNADRLARAQTSSNNLGSGNLIVQLIQHEQSASIGVLLAFVLFVVYWVIAGPGGFYALKHYRQTKHTWVAFAATAGLFTVIAWGAVAAVRPRTITVKHVTVLDHIARVDRSGSHNPDRGDNDRQLQRATSYCSIFLPNYRVTDVNVMSGEGHDIMASWDPPTVSISKFNNVVHYPIDVSRRMASYGMPSRSTTTRLNINWLGGLDPKWGSMLREDPNDPIRVVYDEATKTEQNIRGTIINDLPGDLTNVTIFWIKNQRMRTRRFFSSGGIEESWIAPNNSGQLLNIGNHWKVPGVIQPGGRIALQVPPGSILSENIKKAYLNPYRNVGFSSLGANPNRTISTDDRRNFLEMLSFFHQLSPPQYIITPGTQSDQQTPTFFREIGRELDLSIWFTRPCLIVMGWLQNSAIPIPMEANGEPVISDGLTLVRWIFPLEFREDIAFKTVLKQDEQDDNR
ncbi:MAG: hypothetical protein O7G85_07450 [Planctomycetota bacterium]|nr:hypothetical protein [Planctomycetota bacterium]